MADTSHSKIWLGMSVFVLAMVSTAGAQVIFVDNNATGANDGSSWADAHKDLQDALLASLDGDEIWVAEGTYRPDRGFGITLGDGTATFELKDGVALYGGFPSGGGNWEDRDPIAYETILSGDLNGNDVPVANPRDLLDEPTRVENSYHVVTGSGTDETAVLDGFTITGGNANGSSYPHQYGGGLINDGNPTLTDCTFAANSAEYSGGGMANDTNAGPTLIGCTFNGNSAGSGGGMLDNGTGLTLTDCTFTGNQATSGGGMHNYESSSSMLTDCTFSGNSATDGGGMHNFKSSPRLTNCTFSGNSAQYGNGGGMYNESSSPTLTDCMFSGNAADRGGGMANFDSSSPAVTNCTFSDNSAVFNVGGGGMCNCSSSPTVIGCSFSDNEAVRGGGMSNWPSASPTVTNCTFHNNTAGDGGGGMFNRDSSSPTLTNCAFSGNSTLADGGGMHNMISSSPTLTNCTFSGNEAGTAPGYTGHGGGMSNWSSSSPTVTNCTFAQNSAGALEGGAGMYNSSCSPTVTNCILRDGGDEIANENGSTVAVTYSDVQGGWAGAGNINADPLFVSPGGDDYRLGAGSPCIDAGDNSAVPAGITTDLEGLARFIDDPASADTGSGTSPIVDMGAYEFGSSVNTVPVYRFWSDRLGHHFYTISEAEKNKLIDQFSATWTYEGPVYQAFADSGHPGTSAVYRFWSDRYKGHFYTISESEKDKLVTTYSHVWTYEGPAFYAYPEGNQPAGTSAVYRFWSDTLGGHFYTISESEKNKLVTQYADVWAYEGVAWHAYQ